MMIGHNDFSSGRYDPYDRSPSGTRNCRRRQIPRRESVPVVRALQAALVYNPLCQRFRRSQISRPTCQRPIVFAH